MKSILADVWGVYPWRKNSMKGYFTVIHYHQANSTQLTVHLEYLKKQYTLCPLTRLRDHYVKGDNLPENALFVTFDDGWKSNYDLLPVIKEKEYPVTIYLTTGLVGSDKKPGKKVIYEDYKLDESLLSLISGGEPEPFDVPDDQRTMLSRDEIKEMSTVVDFQSHGVNHHVSTAIPIDLLEYELRESKLYIQKLTGKEVYAFAFPYNIVSEEAYSLFPKYGYTLARAGARKYNRIGTDQYQVNSIGIEPTWTINELRKALLLAELKSLNSK